jgi:voltage-gated potassium channel Kch
VLVNKEPFRSDNGDFMLTVLATLAGSALILAGLYDIFRTLFHPGGKGMISTYVASVIWRGFRLAAGRWRGVLSLAGPATFIASSLTWGLLLTFGWALLYWPRIPEEFSYSPGVDPSTHSGFLAALYVSLVTLGTLGFGDITPDSTWMRLIGPLQALVGFLWLTAIITWVLSIYPDLARRQSFAREVTLLREAEVAHSIDLTELNPVAAEQILGKLISEMVVVRGDFLQFPITYYFHNTEEDSSLPVVIPYVMELAARAAQDECPAEVRFQAARLQGTIDALGAMLTTHFLDMPPESSEQVFAAYARDHFHVD